MTGPRLGGGVGLDSTPPPEDREVRVGTRLEFEEEDAEVESRGAPP